LLARNVSLGSEFVDDDNKNDVDNYFSITSRQLVTVKAMT